MCCGAARGLWMEMLCIMHDAIPRGYLCVGTLTVTPQQLANLAGFPLKECQSLLKELEAANVFSRDDTGIYSRRMKKDTERAVVDKANGKGGGNPNLKRGVNPPDKAAGAQEPEPEPEPEKKEAALSASARPRPDFKNLESKLRKAAGCENSPSPGLSDLSPIIGLMDQGADFEGEILPAIAAKPKPDVRSWKWFIPQIQQFRANKAQAMNALLPSTASQNHSAGGQNVSENRSTAWHARQNYERHLAAERAESARESGPMLTLVSL